MTVLILERVSPSVRGELTRWMIQPHTGLFVGRISARVRERLWAKVKAALKDGAAILICPSNTEQGFAISTAGTTSRMLEDFEGLTLAKTAATR